ncbi:t-SNARE coiled-coil-like proteiny domain-containing protein [Mycena venus]|uniref:t-SNARE coiled-coil-like proteiny domain-containing protein n=1 Tax=Mycena venus TaxID=2733690 RepID=A0A8H7CLP8_9AGAR|nr:t-SNARE coiled-coil-like proteiny domain-containing protein [Mycena venus]
MNCPAPASYTPRAPAELWRAVFLLAGASSLPQDAGYAPFQPLRDMSETAAGLEEESQRLKTCLSLMRVCRLWRFLAAEFLYEDVRIMDSAGLESLASGLRRSAKEDELGGFGRYIRRLELPMRQTQFTQQSPLHLRPFALPSLIPTSSGFRLSDLLRLCPRLEIFSRPCLRLDNEDIYFWGGLVSSPIEDEGSPLLPRLRRLEWYETDLDTRFYGNKNTLRLSELITHAPALEYLFMSSDRYDALSGLPSCPSLHTLRINRSHYHSHHVKCLRPPDVPYVPKLTHLVLHTMLPSPLLAFLSVAGAQLRVLELTFAPQLVFSAHQMQRLLSRCPALEELAFYVGAPEITAPATVGFSHSALRRVRLKLSPEEWYPYKHVLKTQFGILVGPSFPGLEEVVLHDPSRSLARREVWPGLLRALIDRGCRVVYDDETIVESGA